MTRIRPAARVTRRPRRRPSRPAGPPGHRPSRPAGPPGHRPSRSRPPLLAAAALTGAALLAAACGPAGPAAGGGASPAGDSASAPAASAPAASPAPAATPVPPATPATSGPPAAPAASSAPAAAGGAAACAALATRTYLHLTAVRAGPAGGLTVTGNPAKLVCGGPDDSHYDVAAGQASGQVVAGATVMAFSLATMAPKAITEGQLAAYLAGDQGTRIFLVAGPLARITGLQEEYHP